MKLQEYRLKAGLSQSQLGKVAGIPHMSICRIEKPTFDMSQIATSSLIKLAYALDCEPEDLLER